MPTTYELTTAPTAPTVGAIILNTLKASGSDAARVYCIRTHRSQTGGATLWRFLLATTGPASTPNAVNCTPLLTDITVPMGAILRRRLVVRADGVHGVRFVNRETTTAHAETVKDVAYGAVLTACGGIGTLRNGRPLALHVECL